MGQVDSKVKLAKADLSQEIFGMDEATARIAVELSKMNKQDEDKAKMLTDLFIDEIPHVAGYFTIASAFDLPIFKDFILNFLQMRISKDRLGRRELVGIASGTQETKEKVKQGLQSLFSGLKG